MAKATFRQADVRRALKAAVEIGLSVSGYEIRPTGEIVVRTGAEPSSADAALDAWKRSNDARGA